MLSLNNINISLDYTNLLSGISVTFLNGAWINIFGKNGVGKTTLLKTLAAVRETEKNTLLLDNECISRNINNYYSTIAYLGHDLGLKENWTVEENLLFWAQRFDTVIIIPAAIRNFMLDQYTDVFAKNLSMGNKKRLALAIVMISNRRIWLLDEPYSNLDEDGKKILNNMISAHISNGGIAIMTSHKSLDIENITNMDLKYHVL